MQLSNTFENRNAICYNVYILRIFTRIFSATRSAERQEYSARKKQYSYTKECDVPCLMSFYLHLGQPKAFIFLRKVCLFISDWTFLTTVKMKNGLQNQHACLRRSSNLYSILLTFEFFISQLFLYLSSSLVSFILLAKFPLRTI